MNDSTGHNSYIGFLFFEFLVNNAIVNVFVDLMTKNVMVDPLEVHTKSKWKRIVLSRAIYYCVCVCMCVKFQQCTSTTQASQAVAQAMFQESSPSTRVMNCYLHSTGKLTCRCGPQCVMATTLFCI